MPSRKILKGRSLKANVCLPSTLNHFPTDHNALTNILITNWLVTAVSFLKKTNRIRVASKSNAAVFIVEWAKPGGKPDSDKIARQLDSAFLSANIFDPHLCIPQMFCIPIGVLSTTNAATGIPDTGDDKGKEILLTQF